MGALGAQVNDRCWEDVNDSNVGLCSGSGVTGADAPRAAGDSVDTTRTVLCTAVGEGEPSSALAALR